MTNTMTNTMRDLIKKLNDTTFEYEKGTPIMSDEEWDRLYFKLQELERLRGTVLPNSPTQKVVYYPVSELKKILHSNPMLSLQKSKDLKDIEKWANRRNLILMPKLDGLTCALTYMNGFLNSAETRGDGFIGEDVFHNAIVLDSIPKVIPQKEKTVIHGEIIIENQDFKHYAGDYKHPRSYAAGSIRLLDPNECAKRKIKFVAWDLVEPRRANFDESLGTLYDWNFEVVPWISNAKANQDCINEMLYHNAKDDYPIDGAVFRYNNYDEYDAAGATAHHYNGAFAYKFYDEEVETRLRYFDWSMGTTGVLTPVAVFDPVVIDGTTVERASVHNISVLESIFGDPYYGQKIKVIKANQIIPQVTEAFKMPYGEVIARGGVTLYYPERCPVCGSSTEVVITAGGTKVLMCNDPQCAGKFLMNLTHYCSKKGLDIKGLSTATLKDLIGYGWVKELKDLYKLDRYYKEWIYKKRYGAKSVKAVLTSINEHRRVELWRLISAINIPLVGETTAKNIADHFDSYEDFVAAAESGYDFTTIPDIGHLTAAAIKDYDYEPITELVKEYLTVYKSVNEYNELLKGVTICVTGTLNIYPNRDNFKDAVERLGGKVVSAMSGNVKCLVCNKDNGTAKHKYAVAHNIPIVSEKEFIREWMKETKR